jgi:hypothetical protein
LRLAHAFYWRVPLAMLPVLSNRDVLAQAVAMTTDTSRAGCVDLTWAQALVLVSSHLRHLVDTGDYAEVTVDKIMFEAGLLATYMADGVGKPAVAQATQDDITGWAQAALARRRLTGKNPAQATVRLRLTCARIVLQVLRRLGLYEGDPLIGVKGPGRSKRTTRPMTDEEILLARICCTDLEGTYLQPAALALAEATATSTELSAVLVCHIDLEAATVVLTGAKRRAARTGYLSPWGVKQLAARINRLRADNPGLSIGHLPVTYSGAAGGKSAAAAAAILMRGVLEACSLAGQHGIKPGSIAAAYGRRVWQQTGSLPLVAHVLGRNTFDGAAAEIGLSVTDLPEDPVPLLRAAVLGHTGHTPTDILPTPGQNTPVAPTVPDAAARPVIVRGKGTRARAR